MYDMSLYKQLTATGTLTNAGPTSTVIAAQTTATGSPATIYLTSVHFTVILGATGGGGVFNIKDGATVIYAIDATAVGNWRLDFGPRGYPLTNGKSFSISVTGAGTTNASVNCIATALVGG